MKTLFSIIPILLFVFMACSKTATVNPPDSVSQAFVKMYPGQNKPTWIISDSKNYSAKFEIEGHEVTAFFDPAGNWMKTETDYASSELPAVLVKTILGAYHGHGIDKSLKIEKPGVEFYYKIELSRTGKHVEIILSSGGVILPAEP